MVLWVKALATNFDNPRLMSRARMVEGGYWKLSSDLITQ